MGISIRNDIISSGRGFVCVKYVSIMSILSIMIRNIRNIIIIIKNHLILLPEVRLIVSLGTDDGRHSFKHIIVDMFVLIVCISIISAISLHIIIGHRVVVTTTADGRHWMVWVDIRRFEKIPDRIVLIVVIGGGIDMGVVVKNDTGFGTPKI